MILVFKKIKNIRIRKSDLNIRGKKKYSNIHSHP